MMPDQSPSRRHVLEHRGLVAGLVDALGSGDVLDQAPHPNPERRDRTLGEAGNAVGRNGLGCITQALDRGPRCFQNKPTARLMSPRVAPKPRNDDALGRALDTRDVDGVTALYRLVAAPAAQRGGLASRLAHLDRTSVPVEGRYQSDEAPEAHVLHITRGYRRDQRPDLNQVRLDLLVEHQAGRPVLRKPGSGNSRDVQDFGQLSTAHLRPGQITAGTTFLVADSALYRAANLQTGAGTRTQGLLRGPAPGHEAPAVFAQAAAQTMAPLTAGSRAHVVRASAGGVEQRWGLLPSAARQPQAQRAVDQPRLQHRAQDVPTCKKLGRTALACAADAQQALARFAQGVQTTVVAQSTLRPTPRDDQPGRPGHGPPPAQLVSQLDGARARRVAARQALLAQPRCVILATQALADTRFAPPALGAGYQGQAQAERGVRCLKAPQVWASSRDLNKPEPIMALLRVMPVCLVV